MTDCKHERIQFHEIGGAMYIQERCPDCDMRAVYHFDHGWSKPKGNRPSEQIREQLEILSKENQTGDLTRDMILRNALEIRLIEQHLDTMAGFPQGE